MSLKPLFVIGLMGALILSGCTREAEVPAEAVEQGPAVAAPAAATAPPIGYACESGQTVTLQYPDTATASLVYRGQSYALRLVPSGTGARYSGSGLEWWIATRDDQESATLSRLGPNDDVGVSVLERCGRPSANPALPAPGSGEPTAGGVLPTAVACRSAQLRLTNEAGDAGAGNRVNVFGLTNAGTTACSVSGYPTVSLLDAQGRALSTIRSDQNPATLAPVTLAAGGKAYFDVAWNVVPNEGNGERVCPAVATVRVSVAADSEALTIPLAFTPCGGRIRLNPFRATTEPGVPPSITPASATPKV